MDRDWMEQLAYELGEVLLFEEQCPGVYYLSVAPADGSGREYYVVLDDAPVSPDVRSMGRRLAEAPAWVYPMEAEGGAWAAVEFEVLKYKTKHNLPLPDGKSLWEAAMYGMELCPDYFGTYPAPLRTPWGNTVRHRLLDSGIYWLETDQCVEVLAVCYPVWATELFEGLLSIAGKLDCEGELGYRYFTRQTSCVVVFELLRTRSALVSTGLIRKPELMNAIWKYHPEYAVGYNAQEQAGLNDALGLLLYTLGVENRGLNSSPECMIAITPGVGTDFIGGKRK